MLDKDLHRLKRPYSEPARPEDSDLVRLAGPLGLDVANLVELGGEIFDDLDPQARGIGWWTAYPDIDRQTRILLSDYLVVCTRAVPDNLLEAVVERLEFDHAAEDFRTWMERGIKPGRRMDVKPPRGPYEELSQRRAQTHLVGVLRAWGTALDCVGGCLVGVGGLPTDLVRADMGTAWRSLAQESQKNPVLEQLRVDLTRAEAAAGPSGWRDWLLGMRNTVVHRGRRTTTWGVLIDRSGVTGFSSCQSHRN